MEKLLTVKTGKEVDILKVEAELNECLSLKFYKNLGKLDGDVSDLLSQFNSVAWEVKCNLIFPELNTIDDLNKNNYVKECLEVHFGKLLAQRDIKYLNVELENINVYRYDSEALDIAQQLSCFSEMPIPEKTKAFLQPYIEKLEASEGADMEKVNKRSIYSYYAEPIRPLEEYVMYIGDNPKYKGFVGIIIDHREDSAPNKISFLPDCNGYTLKNYWSKDSNLVKFYI